MLTKLEVIDRLEYPAAYPDIKESLDQYFMSAIYSKDYEYIKVLLEAGVNPNVKNDCLLQHYLHEYMVEKTIRGELIRDIMVLLLNHGIDPDVESMNGIRAYDYAVRWKVIPIAELLKQHVKDTAVKEPI